MGIYTSWQEIVNIPKNTPIWACEYEFCDNKTTMSLIQKPVKGMIINRRFYPIKKNSNTEIVSSRKVDFYSRKYADTYEECVALYNFLVQKKIEWFEERIKETKEDFIKVENK